MLGVRMGGRWMARAITWIEGLATPVDVGSKPDLTSVLVDCDLNIGKCQIHHLKPVRTE